MDDGQYDAVREELDQAAAWSPPPEDGDAPPRPFGIVSRGDITPWIGREPEPVPFVIADFVEQGAVALLAGEGGAGKSYASLTAAISVAAGRPFYGKFAMAGKAVCLFAEDSREAIHARLKRLCDALHVPMETLQGRLFPLSLLDDEMDDRVLWEDLRPTPRLGILEAELAGIADLQLLVIDNVTHVFAGNEIDRKQVGRFLTALTGIARRLGIGIILIHHASKSQDGTSLRMASGSTAWIAQCRAAAELRKASGDEPPMFRVRKINNGREWEAALMWTEAGALIPVLEATGAVATMERHGHEKAFIACLVAAANQGRTVSETRNSPRYAPKVFAGMPESRGAKVRDLEKAMEALFAAGEIRVGVAGKTADRKAVLGIISTQDTVADGGE